MAQLASTKEKSKSFLIVGFGLEGQSAFTYLKKKYPLAEFAVADQKKVKVADKKVKLFFGKNYLKKAKNYDVIVKSPSVPLNLAGLKAARQAGRAITSLTKIFFAECQGKIIGVTGTKGKSTTTSLIYKILKQAGLDAYLVGNIGHNPFSYLGKDRGKGKIFIYELSSYQLADLKQSPNFAIFLDIFPDHLPWHGSYKKYRLAKANIIKYQRSSDYFIFNSHYRFIKNLAVKSRAQKIDYQKQCRLENGYIYYERQKLFPASKIKLLGRHNLENIFACICLAKIFKINNIDIARAVADFKGLEHRLELAGVFKGVSYYDDAISTTPESTLAAIDVFKDKLGTIILGGLDRGYNFDKLARKLAEVKIKNIVLFPDSGARIWRSLEKVYRQRRLALPKKLATRQMDKAVEFAGQNTAAGQICLLSTASPSYSIFKNYQEKGSLFKKQVKKLPR